jgi:hypothetical protein
MDGLACDNIIWLCMRPVFDNERVVRTVYPPEEGSQDEEGDGRREMVVSVYLSLLCPLADIKVLMRLT